ncbi:MAG: HNH endonuclease signature motif containing protein [bacterium]|nr:HNH endonuclease signature motif containing protein [bacterium]
MSTLYVSRLSSIDRETLIKRLHESQDGNCFICGKEVDLDLHVESIDIDHIEPTSSGGKDSQENFALTHDSCNRSKQASHLQVARVLATFDQLAERVAKENRSPNLGDVLAEYGGSKFSLPVTLDNASIKTTFAELEQNEVSAYPIFEDRISGFKSSFINLPIEYLHHDDHINPRAIGSNLRKLVVEFHKPLPQLHVSLGWIDTSEGDRVKVQIFDGQHKAAAQVLLGARILPVRIFINPDVDVLLTANTNAGTVLRQVAFDKSVQRSLGSSILSNRIDRYRADLGLGEDDESFSERDLVNHFKGEAREMQRYVLDRVRHGITTHPDNQLRDYIEYGGRSTDRPLSYIAIERSFYRFFIHGGMLTSEFNYKYQEGTNPRQLEIEQTVRLMNIVAKKIYIGQFDPTRGTRRIENDVQKGKPVEDKHLRAFRMSKEEIVHNWVRLVRQIIYHYYITTGKSIDETKLFHQAIPEPCWKNVENFIDTLSNLPLWINNDLSISAFGTKRTIEYWQSVFESGKTPDGATILSSGLDLLEMIKD